MQASDCITGMTISTRDMMRKQQRIRVADEMDGVLPLREPLPLLRLADAHDVLREPESLLSECQFGSDLALFMTLWSHHPTTGVRRRSPTPWAGSATDS